MEKTLLDLGREIQAIARTGITFTEGAYDLERYRKLEEIAAELIARNSVHSKEFLGQIFSAEAGYVTPKIDVRAAVFRDGKILMVKETASGAWTLPGGYADVNQSLSTAVEREVFEESGYTVKAVKLAGIYDHRKHEYKPHLYHFYKTYVLCDLVGGEPRASIETSEVGWYSEAELETLELDHGRIAKKHVHRMFEHRARPGLATDFD